MQRFYQAVELDEAEMERKRSASVEPKSKKKTNASAEVSKHRNEDENEFASIRDEKPQMVNYSLLSLQCSTLHEIQYAVVYFSATRKYEK